MFMRRRPLSGAAVVGAGAAALADKWLHPQDLLAAEAEIEMAIEG